MKKNGFTLIELLAVLVILAIIALITVVSVNFIIKDAKSSLTEQQIANIEKAAKVYYLKEGMSEEAECISVADLLEKGYIEGNAVINPETVENMTGSVKITYSGNKYYYTYQEKVCRICDVEQQNPSKYSIGDKVTCDIEGDTPDVFYIIQNADLNATSVKTLTEKNISIVAPYRQSDNAGSTDFSTSYSWSGNNVNVYGHADLIKPIINQYVDYLNTSLNGVTGTMLFLDDIINKLGCAIADPRGGGPGVSACPSYYAWVYSTNYWLGTSSYSDNIYRVDKGNYLFDLYYRYPSEVGTEAGVRPVITISTSDIG